ncbi:hypothetical protein H2248_008653 [Termitomyces sp. 'cryptogamus']|nr:hypothetical protein H2248_008653 [Termitomyces sp. 'cryptogamus']
MLRRITRDQIGVARGFTAGLHNHHGWPNPTIPGTLFRVVGAVEAESEVGSTLRTTKRIWSQRELDDAFHILDNAVRPL